MSSYTPTTWNTGDTISASSLNKIENGIANAGGALICGTSYANNDYTLDKTVQEIYDALLSGTPVYIKFQYGTLGTNYESKLYLAPVIKIYGYNYASTIRICASKPQSIGSIGNKDFIFSPAVMIYQANAMNAYPTFYDTVFLSDDYALNDGGVD